MKYYLLMIKEYILSGFKIATATCACTVNDGDRNKTIFFDSNHIYFTLITF